MLKIDATPISIPETSKTPVQVSNKFALPANANNSSKHINASR